MYFNICVSIQNTCIFALCMCFSLIQAMGRGCKRQRVQYITTADELHRHLPDSLRNVVDDYVYSYEHRQKLQGVLIFTDLRRFCNNVDEVKLSSGSFIYIYIQSCTKNQRLPAADGVENWELRIQEYIQLALPMTSLTEYFENGDDLLLMRKCTHQRVFHLLRTMRQVLFARKECYQLSISLHSLSI